MTAVAIGIVLSLASVPEAEPLFQGESFRVPSNVSSPFAVDVDGDGVEDLAFRGEAGGFTILRVKAEGAVVPWVDSTEPGPVLVGAGDFDGDGLGDLARATPGVLELWGGRGDGSFAQRSALSWDRIPAPPWESAVADFDGDGRDDLAFSAGPTNLTIAYGAPDGRFEIVSRSWPFLPGADLAVADLDADGDPDIVLLDAFRGRLVSARNLGGRSFATASSARVAEGLRLLGIAPVDPDRFPDVVVAADATRPGIRILRGVGNGQFVDTGVVPVTASCWNGTVGDWDLDGDVDLACAVGAFELPTFRNDGNSGFERAAVLRLPGRPVTVLPVRSRPTAPVLLAQVDAGNAVDVATLWTFPAFPGDDSPFPGVFEALERSVSHPLGRVEIDDLDGDGDGDWLAFDQTVLVWLNDGAGNPLGPPTVYEGASEGWGAAYGDVDGDGRKDLVLSDYPGGSIVVRRGLGNGGFGARDVVVPLEERVRAVILADVDGDGVLDLAVHRYDGVSVHLGDGAGAFGPGEEVFDWRTEGPIVPVDGDADGAFELAIGSSYGPIAIVRRSSVGVWEPASWLPESDVSIGLGAGDLNADGLGDLVRLAIREDDGTRYVEILASAGDGTFESLRHLEVLWLVGGRAIVTDADLDGKADVVTRRQSSLGAPYTVVVPGAAFPDSRSPRHVFAPGIPGIGDVDGDGRPDLTTFGPDRSGSGSQLWVARDAALRPVPPVAAAGEDQTLECTSPEGAMATLDGSGSTDNGTIVSWNWWSPAIGETFGAVVDWTIPLGAHAITLTVTDDVGLAGTDSVHIVVRDTTAPAGSISFPGEGACLGPSSLPVVVADSFTDVCDPTIERTWTPAGPSAETHGDHAIALEVRDASGNAASGAVAFTIDTTPPEVTLSSPGGGFVAGQIVGLSVLFTATDDDGAAGEVTAERVLLSGCVLLDGTTYGDADGVLSDESISLSPGLMCEAASRCGWTTLPEPELRVEAEDCAGNVGSASQRFAGSLLLLPGVCGGFRAP